MIVAMTAGNEPKERQVNTTLAIEVFGRLRHDLKANRFKPGERLDFSRIKEMYDVGVAPLREALSRLVEAGLVVQVGQKGFRAAPVSLDDLTDVVDTRRFLEVRAFQESIRLGDDDWEGRIIAAFHGLSKVSQRSPESLDKAAWEVRHGEFHKALMSACRSRWLLQLWSTVFDQAERYRSLALGIGHWSPDELGDHKQLLDAALARDVEHAGELLHRHIGFSAQRLLEGIRPYLPEEKPVSSRSRRSARDQGVV
jgi:GntR family transcriptional regulator, carbon starvation induced regulator